MNDVDEPSVFELLRQEPERAWTLAEIVERAEIPAREIRELRRILKHLVKKGDLASMPGRRFAVAPEVPEAPPTPSGRELGTLRIVGKAAYVEPEAARDEVSHPVLLGEDSDHSGLEDGLLVEYEIVQRRTTERAAIGRIASVLGRPGDRRVEMRRLLIEHGLDRGFPPDVSAEAESFGGEVRPEDVAGRRDIRHLPIVTIDGEDAKDFDDAVCAERLESDEFKIYVAIADVSHYVRKDTPLDREAFRRGTSVYLTDRAIPMLPEQLSNNLCSLLPNVDRLCVVAEMRVDREGRTHDEKFYRAVMRSRARLTYTQVARALEGEPDEVCTPLLPNLMRLWKAAQRLLVRRLRRGSIDLDLPEARIVFDAEGNPMSAALRERNDAHRLIEDLMLAANEAVAGFTSRRNLPTVYRIHEEPDRKKLEAFVELSQSLGIPFKLKKKIHPRDLAQLAGELAEHEAGPSLNSLLLRTMAQARYHPQNEGHFGLAAERYLHFTSPIRRYPDLMVHRLLLESLDGGVQSYRRPELKTIAAECSAAERRAMAAERESMDLDRALIASRHVGERHSATIVGIQRFGIFATIGEPFVDGMVPVHTIQDDYYVADEIGSVMRGKHTGREFRLAHRIEVEIAGVNIARRQVELRLAETAATVATRRPAPRARKENRAPRDGRRQRAR